MGSHFGEGAPSLVGILVGIEGYDLDFDPWPLPQDAERVKEGHTDRSR